MLWLKILLGEMQTSCWKAILNSKRSLNVSSLNVNPIKNLILIRSCIFFFYFKIFQFKNFFLYRNSKRLREHICFGAFIQIWRVCFTFYIIFIDFKAFFFFKQLYSNNISSFYFQYKSFCTYNFIFNLKRKSSFNIISWSNNSNIKIF